MRAKEWVGGKLKTVGGMLLVLVMSYGTLSGSDVVETAEALRLAVLAAKPGETVVMRNGIYANTTWMIIGNGTAEAPVTVRAETPGRVVSTGRSAMRIAGSHMVIEGFVFTEGGQVSGSIIDFRTSSSAQAQHVRLTQCAIINNNVELAGARTHYVSLYGRYNRVDHCYFAGHNQNGVTLVVWLPTNVPAGQDPAVYHRVDNNHFADRIDGGENGWETIRIGDSNTSLQNARVLVEENLFSRVDGEIEIISNKSCENIYRNNTFFQSRGTLTLRHGDRCVVDGNYFLGGGLNATGGIRVIGEDHLIINNYLAGTTGRDGAAITLSAGIPDSPLSGYYAAHNATIAFNTFYFIQGAFLSTSTGYGGGTRTVLPENLVFANNVFIAGVHTGGTFVIGEEVASHTFAGNLIEGRPVGRTTDEGFAHVALQSNHTFVDGILRPRSNSPVLSAAVGDFPDVEVDIDGQPRIAPKDAGFDQRSNAAVTRRGWLRAEDVGPAWLDADRSLRFLQQLRALLHVFNDGALAVSDGWVEVTTLGSFYIDLYPWIHHAGLAAWVYAPGKGGDGFWSHDRLLGWIYLSAAQYPFVYSADRGWLYFYGETGPQRLFWDFASGSVYSG